MPRLSMQNGDQAFDLELRLRKTYFMGKLTREWRPVGGDQLAVMDRLGAVPGTDRSVRSASLQDREVSPLPYGEEHGAVPDGGPVPGLGRGGGSGELEPVCVCRGGSGELRGSERVVDRKSVV